jgi:hypothetical protein
MNQINALLAAMIASYAVSIGIVWHNYKTQKAVSISQIICKNRMGVISSMAVMAVATCMYESQRAKNASSSEDAHWHNYGFACIGTLLFCIFSLVLVDESHFAHHVFATIGFGAIIVFTCVHAALVQTPICAAVAATQFAACAHIMHRHGSNGDIFWGEVVFIGAFCIFYLYLHYNILCKVYSAKCKVQSAKYKIICNMHIYA